jgi:single-strand DNA-binding protein
MSNLNSLLIEGCLTADVELSVSNEGTPFCMFTIDSKRRFKMGNEMQEETSYFDVEVWPKLAENCKKLGQKGRGVRMVGRIAQKRWTDPGCNEQLKVVIIAEYVEFRPELRLKRLRRR